MMNKPRFEVAVGFFVFTGFVILAMIVFFVSGVYMFRPGYHLSARFDYVGIINRGAPIRFSGMRVGEVTVAAVSEVGWGGSSPPASLFTAPSRPRMTPVLIPPKSMRTSRRLAASTLPRTTSPGFGI